MLLHSSASIANAFLNRAFRDKKHISPMKIQKLLYLAQGYSLAYRDQPMMDELFEVWRFGPVLPMLYQQCKHYSSDAITDFLHDYDYKFTQCGRAPLPTDNDVNKIVDFVWNNYWHVPATELSKWTHEEGGPWHDIMHANGGMLLRNQDIPNDMLKAYFKKLCGI